MKITEDVRKYAAEHALDESAAIKHGLEEKAAEFAAEGYELYSTAEGFEQTGARRDRRAGPRGREIREEFESMQEKRKEFAETGAELYAKA